MKNFLVLYNMPPEAFDAFNEVSEEEKEKDMDSWMKWMEAHKEDFVDAGNPVGLNKRVTMAGAAEERNEVGGYSIVKAESHEAACAIFSDSPHLDVAGAYIDVMEIVEM
jgi:hypothetical protein